MSAQTTRATLDLDPARPAATTQAKVALALAILAIPGVVMTWGVVPGGGFTTGVPIAIVALVLGLRARPGRMAIAAVAIAGVCLAFVAICTAALSL
jgi:hypothetical protein